MNVCYCCDEEYLSELLKSNKSSRFLLLFHNQKKRRCVWAFFSAKCMGRVILRSSMVQNEIPRTPVGARGNFFREA